jgi:formamidopyrimidine-DNA glycosylase
MPELPDIYILAKSMSQAITGRRIVELLVNQPRVLNVGPRAFANRVIGHSVEHVFQRGKWIVCELDDAWTILLNLGMGGEVRLHESNDVPDKKREKVVFRLDDGRQLWVHFWWFGQVHLAPKGKHNLHPQISKLGPEPLAEEFTRKRLAEMLKGKRGRIKVHLLNQSFIAGIGNVYVQDILWYAGLHPERSADTLTPDDIVRLHSAIQRVLNDGIKYGGGPGEQDVRGKNGSYMEHRPIGYRTGQPCPKCATTIEELRVGATTSYVCPRCQT